MVKVIKWDKEKKKKDWDEFRMETRGMKYHIFPNIRWALGENFRNDKWMAATILIFAFGQYLRNLILACTDKYIVELAAVGFENLHLLILCLFLFVGNFFFHTISIAAGNYTGYTGFRRAVDHFYGLLMQKCMDTDYENNEKMENNNNLNKAREGVVATASYTPVTVRSTIQRTLELFTFSAILSVLDLRLVPIVILPSVAAYFIQHHKRLWVWNMSSHWQLYARQMDYINRVGRDFKYAKDVRIFGMQEWFEKVFSRSFKKRLFWYRQQDAWEFRHNLLLVLVKCSGKFAAYIYVIWMVVHGEIGVGDFVLYFNSVTRLSSAMDVWCENISGYQWLSNNINYIRAYLETEDNTKRDGGVPVPKGTYEIEFRGVSYTYFGADHPTIKNLSFTLEAGENLALVGLNGAGKTTVVKLMCGLYDPTEGEILLNGINIKEYNRKEYFGLFSAVFQDFTMLSASVAENITGQVAECMDKDRMFSCMKKAGIYEKIMSLKERENTLFGRGIYEEAVDFSGGERQKLALAKALYKDAPVLLLDEPTAALDAIAEQEMYLNYVGFSEGKSSLFISHRLASTRFCDRIILLSDGGILECGSHEELMELNGEYAKLFHIQSGYYNEGKEGKKIENGEWA